MKFHFPRPTPPLAVALLASAFFLSTLPHRAAAEMPAGLEEALTGHAWSFPKAKPPTRFLSDGTVVDGNGTFRFWWDLDKATGTVHLLEKGPKDKDKARIDLWFWNNLQAFSWYDSHGQSSGVGIRLDEQPAQVQPAAAPAVKEPEKSAPPQAFDPKTAPSVQLQAFAAAWLEKLTGALDAVPLPRADLMALQTDFQARLPLATAQQKPAYQAALQTCATFSNLMDAREAARTALSNTQATTSGSVGRSGRKDAAIHDSAFVASGAVSSAVGHWQQQQKPWRDAIQQSMVREKQAELVANNTPDRPSGAPASATPH